MSDDYYDRFSSLARLYGEHALSWLQDSHVAVIGIGGVGSWAAEALARSGIGELTLVDLDEVCLTNVNRQIHATDATVGRSKVRVMAERVASINPACRVHARDCFFSDRTAEEILNPGAGGFCAVIDAIDVVRPKCLLLAECRNRNIPVVTCGAAGGRSDASMVRVADLSRTHNDALLLQVRKNLRSNYGFPGGDKPKNFGIRAVFSPEAAVYPQSDGCVSTERPPDLPGGLRCDAGYGTAAHLTAIFGLLAAGEIVNLIARGKVKSP